ncbi:hypothetical protein JB92DRAFT_2832288 [Gautieria morchelliformis]|nr:hypothetical protein JB92DRAFT_2832288 [Gautieria morchelliformis]
MLKLQEYRPMTFGLEPGGGIELGTIRYELTACNIVAGSLVNAAHGGDGEEERHSCSSGAAFTMGAAASYSRTWRSTGSLQCSTKQSSGFEQTVLGASGAETFLAMGLPWFGQCAPFSAHTVMCFHTDFHSIRRDRAAEALDFLGTAAMYANQGRTLNRNVVSVDGLLYIVC